MGPPASGKGTQTKMLAEKTGSVIEAKKEVLDMPYNRKAFGIVISRLRFEKGWTQEEASGLMGIARSHLVMLESGKKTVKLDTLWRIAETFEVKPSELVRLMEKDNDCSW